jgi:hypothetical protein
MVLHWVVEASKQQSQGQSSKFTSCQELLAGRLGENSCVTSMHVSGKNQDLNDNSDTDSSFMDAAALEAAKLIAQGKKPVSAILLPLNC